jgi:hypothetical protein
MDEGLVISFAPSLVLRLIVDELPPLRLGSRIQSTLESFFSLGLRCAEMLGDVIEGIVESIVRFVKLFAY